MEAKPKEIIINETELGNEPFVDWIESLDPKTQDRISMKINRIRAGNFMHCRSVIEGVSELIIDFGPGYRAYFGQDKKHVVLLGGGNKSSRYQMSSSQFTI